MLATLQAAGMLDGEQRARVDKALANSRRSICAVLAEMGIISPEESKEVLELLYNAPFVKLSSYMANPDAIGLVPEYLARKHNLIPVDVEGRTLTVAMSDPTDIVALDDLKAVTNCEIAPLVAEEADIVQAVSQYYGGKSAQADEAVKLGDESGPEGAREGDGSEDLQLDDLKSLGEQAPIIEMVNQIILRAAKAGASDIHIEPTKEGLTVRFRIDGVLRDSVTIPRSARAAIVSRVKIMSQMDISEKRLPQDGRFQARVEDGQIDFRVSTLPGVMGEKVVIRLLDMSKGVQELSKLGMEEDDYTRLLGLIQKTTGILIVTGPTGSGKTSTLYSVLDMIKSSEKNIITIEDPVEYRLDRIYQVQVHPKIGLDFAGVLRSVLRQDPDIIMVGEIRDMETAQLAVRAALTGHMVLSTMHTNSAAQSITRSTDLGLNRYLISATYNGLIAQRLMRRLCDRCKRPARPKEEALELLGPAGKILKGVEIFEAEGCPASRGLLLPPGETSQTTPEDTRREREEAAEGCPHCNETGYRGRTGVFEVISLGSAEMKELILSGGSAGEISALARKETGASSLLENAVKKVARGETSLDEVMRVTL